MTRQRDHDGSVWEMNQEVLRRRDPGLAEVLAQVAPGSQVEVLAGRRGRPTLRVRGRTLHSLYDPENEASLWVEQNRKIIEGVSQILIFGFGLGYHLRELVKINRAQLLVFEPSLEVLRAALETLDLRDVLDQARIFQDVEVALPHLKEGFVLLEYPPSVKVWEEYFQKVRCRLKALQRKGSPLKIQVVGPIYGGSLPVARHCASALRSLGHHVDFVDCSLFKEVFLSIDKWTPDVDHRNNLKEAFVQFASDAVLARCVHYQPDLVVALAQAPLPPRALETLRRLKVPIAFWFVEDFRLRDYWKGIAPLYDYVFCIQREGFLDLLRSSGIERCHYLPMAACPQTHRPLALSQEEIAEFGSDVSFVGAGYYNRRQFLTGLLDFDLKVWGTDWDLHSPLGRCVQGDGTWLETETIVKIFNATKININLHSSTTHEGADPFGDFVNPRTFEIASCGAFQLVDYRTEMAHLFEIGEEIVCFKDLEDLRQKIRFFLHHADQRREMAKKARERVLREHTYEHRMKELLDFLYQSGLELPPWSAVRENAEAMLRKAGPETPLGRFLASLAETGELSMDHIVDAIRSKRGPLGEVERIFLFLHELEQLYGRSNG